MNIRMCNSGKFAGLIPKLPSNGVNGKSESFTGSVTTHAESSVCFYLSVLFNTCLIAWTITSTMNENCYCTYLQRQEWGHT